jgi:hypothetical protein
MATPQALRTAITALAVLADNDLDALWRQVETPEQAREALEDVLPPLVSTYSLASATISADWYDDMRDIVQARGRFTAIPAEPAEQGSDVLARWGVGPLFATEPDWRRARTLVAGGMQLRIANASRYTVAGSSVADPAADGWMRQGSGECAFCAMLIGRGAVYSEAGADFASHDHCRCSAVPAFKGEPRPVKPFTPSKRKASDADRARVREYLRTH